MPQVSPAVSAASRNPTIDALFPRIMKLEEDWRHPGVGLDGKWHGYENGVTSQAGGFNGKISDHWWIFGQDVPFCPDFFLLSTIIILYIYIYIWLYNYDQLLQTRIINHAQLLLVNPSVPLRSLCCNSYRALTEPFEAQELHTPWLDQIRGRFQQFAIEHGHLGRWYTH